MPIPLLSTKLYIPPSRVNAVSRPRLTQKLLAGLAQPGSFALLSGPAGFGKTTLLSEFAASLQQPVAWVSLDASDSDPNQFWSYVITACQSVHADIGESVVALLQLPQGLPAEAVPSFLINDVALFGQDLYLVLDDYHLIQNDTIHAAMTFLIEHIPGNLHIVISTRVDPPWPLARFRARNQLVEIRARDLRFNSAEAAAFLHQILEMTLSDEDVETLEERTEGWAAGLQLAALSMRGRSEPGDFVNSLKGSHVYIAEYLVEEVLLLQPVSVQNFLLQTSILKRLNVDLCEVVTDSKQGQSILQTLLNENLFVVSLDDEGKWYRYHNLFADLLQARLQRSLPKEQVNMLHQRAAEWYEQAGMVAEAIEHALTAQDHQLVLRLVEENALQIILQAHVRTVEGWFDTIPIELFEKSPRLNMAYAWLNLFRGAVTQSIPYFERLGKIFSVPDSQNQNPSIQGEWLALQSKLVSLQGKQAESRDLAREALNVLPETDFLIRNMVYVNLASTYEQMLDYDHAAETFQMIARNARLLGDYTFETLGLSGQARMELLHGHLHKTFEIASEGIRRLEETGRKTPFSATFFGELSEVYYQWHQLDQARSLSLRSVNASGPSGYSDPEIYNHILFSKICQMEGDWKAAIHEMHKACDLAGRIPPALIKENVISQQVRVDLAAGRLAEAHELLKPEGFTFGDPFVFPELANGGNITQPISLLYNSALRVLLLQNLEQQNPLNLTRGLSLATSILAGELHCSQIPLAIETLLIRSQIYDVLGEEKNSLADVIQALMLGEPEGFISVFIEEGAPVAEALRRILTHKMAGAIRPDYVNTILNAFPKKMTTFGDPARQPVLNSKAVFKESNTLEPIIEPLTQREREVLELIAEGDSNKEIATKLIITVSAVKKHTGNIFGKLNVNSRTQAVARARLLKLLPLDQA